MPTFAELGLCEPICRALDPDAMPSPTLIQQRAIPPLLEGHDIVAVAPLGAGKTAAYLLPLLHRLAYPPLVAEAKTPRALVLTSARERAEVIGRAITGFARFVAIRAAATADAAGWNRQAKELRTGVEVVVATPRQLLELQRERAVVLHAVEFVVLDDADEMLEMGLWADLERIALALPEQRQGALFAAAASPTLDELARGWLHEWEEIDAPAPAKKPKVERARPGPDPSLQVDPATPPELPGWLDEPQAAPVALPGWLDEELTPADAPAADADPIANTPDAAATAAPTPRAKPKKPAAGAAKPKPGAKKKAASKARRPTRKRD